MNNIRWELGKGFYLFRRIADFCSKCKFLKWISKIIWYNQPLACNYCGKLIGISGSVISKFGFACWDCLDELKRK